MILKKLRIKTRSSLCLGGVTASSVGADRTTALDEWHRPFIPATALRGALRLNLERLLRGLAIEEARTPDICDPTDESSYERSCSCAACRLFGSGQKEGLVRVGRASLTSPTFEARDNPTWTTIRPGIAVSRRTGSVVENRLFFSEVTRPFEDLIFEANLDIAERVEKEDLEALFASIRATDAIGGGRTRGFGSISIEIHEVDGQKKKASGPILVKGATSCIIRATALEPFHIGENLPEGFHHPTLDFIPSSTLRGAVAWSLIRTGQLDSETSEIDQLFEGEDSIRFSDMLPEPSSDHETDPMTWVVPASLHRCKTHPTEHPAVDLLGFRILWEAGLVTQLDSERSVFPSGCIECGATLKSAHWSSRFSGQISKRIVTRVALGRSTGSAADAHLYSMELVEPIKLLKNDLPKPIRLAAMVDFRSAEKAVSLLSMLHDQQIRVGSGRNRGLGSLRIEIVGNKKDQTIKRAYQRVKDFNEALRGIDQKLTQTLETQPLLDKETLYIPMLMVTPFAHCDQDDHPLKELGVSTPFLSIVNAERQGGFDQRDPKKPRSKPFRTLVGRGSVFVYEVHTDTSPEQIEQWAKLGRRGLGQGQEQGFGRFYIAHDDHQCGLTSPDYQGAK